VGRITLYARFGDWFALTLLGVCVLVWGGSRWGRKV
jgi:apolipoprotein N-acyltransferase